MLKLIIKESLEFSGKFGESYSQNYIKIIKTKGKVMKTFNLKEARAEYDGWNIIKFEVVYSNKGVARIYIENRKTKYNAGGYGYCKESSVIAEMVNDLIEIQAYNPKVYGNINGLLSQGGVGVSSLQKSLKSIGVNLEQIYSGKDSNVFRLDLSVIN